jgi:kynureninase
VTIGSGQSTDSSLSTEKILSVIEEHASSAALVLLPGIQYYTGQLLDIATITSFAHKHGLLIIWDLAHAVGNVPLSLHDWNVDAAVWCTYKYLNGGPGCIGGMFVHSRNSRVTSLLQDEMAHDGYRNRLSGWWGNSKATRFLMETKFHPVSGAAGFQLSNPSILDMTSLCASLEVFEQAGGMSALRPRSLKLTAYLEELLDGMPPDKRELFRIITPREPERRGAQLSILLADGMLSTVMKELAARSVIVDDRKPNVVRVAPAPLYNTFEDCFGFAEAFEKALEIGRPERPTFAQE